MAYADGQILQQLAAIRAAMTVTSTVHGVMGDILQELQQLRIAVSEFAGVDLGLIDPSDYSPTSIDVAMPDQSGPP